MNGKRGLTVVTFGRLVANKNDTSPFLRCLKSKQREKHESCAYNQVFIELLPPDGTKNRV